MILSPTSTFDIIIMKILVEMISTSNEEDAGDHSIQESSICTSLLYGSTARVFGTTRDVQNEQQVDIQLQATEVC